ncbi:hypothetical protein ACSNOB_05010 [Micromonospora sp. URMC 106]|uniref:hypothetical protein n=1 Tax=Micromonospora sp. URMC 106 TaxID=3423408 RepID=UPI003F1BCC6A
MITTGSFTEAVVDDAEGDPVSFVASEPQAVSASEAATSAASPFRVFRFTASLPKWI